MYVTGLREATNGVRAYRLRVEKEALLAFRAGAQQVTNWERQNHPWRNRTTQAEQKIKCIAFKEGTLIIMENAHYAVDPRTGFKYGIALELRHDGRFAILQTGLRRWWSWTIQNFIERMSATV
jgi:hypothetical protein